MAVEDEEDAVNRLMIVARLKPDAHAAAEELLQKGPPFDPETLGFYRHAAYLTTGEVIFLFEAPEVEWIVNDIIDDALIAEVLPAWEAIVEGTPHVAHERYYWTPGQNKLGVGLGT
ncbi:MAG TPA: hypothetical protein VFU26_03620 [Gaiellaceae bacterium]|nr:hypothetical protein [Gaiellaceae bacterium]